VGSFGERLQREREMRGVTLDEIAEATKIGTRSLRALEAQEFEKLPGGIFNKGFVRAYAKFLGIDEEQAVADYETAAREKLAAKGAKTLPVPRPEQDEASEEERAAVERSRRAGMIVVLLAAAAFVLAYFVWAHYSQAVNPSAPQPPATSEPVPAESAPAERVAVPATPELEPGAPTDSINPAPSASSAVPVDAARETALEGAPTASGSAPAGGALATAGPRQTPAAGSEAQPQEFEVRLQAVEDCWVSIAADGQPVMEDLLSASSEKTVRARREISLKVGNAGGVKVFFNGKLLPPLGEPNKTSMVNFTPEGLQVEGRP
jgi:cytoskeleton protein RodZ